MALSKSDIEVVVMPSGCISGCNAESRILLFLRVAVIVVVVMCVAIAVVVVVFIVDDVFKL